MQISITARHLKLTAGMADYANKKVSRLQRYLDKVINAKVRMSVEKYRHTAEVIVHSKGDIFKAIATSGDMYSAIDMVVDKLEMQLSRHKEKIKKRHVPSPRTFLLQRGKGALREELAVELPEEDFEFESETLSAALPAQAASQLHSQGKKYLLFINPETDRVNLIYEKENGKYAIVEPEY